MFSDTVSFIYKLECVPALCFHMIASLVLPHVGMGMHVAHDHAFSALLIYP